MSKMKKAASAPRPAKQHWTIMRENHVYLLRNLRSGDILPYLYQERVLTLDEYNKLDGMQDQERNKALLIKIEQISRRQFRHFLLSLDESDQSFVIDHLENQTGLILRKEFQVTTPIHLDPGIIEKLEKDKQDMESTLKELEGKHERELEELQKKLKENEALMQAQGKETDRSKKELREEISRLKTSIDSLNRKWERKEEELKTKIKNHEERIRTLESQKKLEKDKQDMESTLKELEGKHERELEELQKKLKENEALMQAQGKETDRSKKELRKLEKDEQDMESTLKELKGKHERELEELQKKLKENEAVMQAQGKETDRSKKELRGGRSTSKVTDRSQTDDEKLSNQQVPVITPAEIETFFGAVRQGKLDEVKRLLEQGKATLDCRGKDKRTAVMEAVLYRQEHVFDFFLKTNCDLSAVDDYIGNVFHFACCGGSEYIVRKLFEKHKIDIECRGLFGFTPLWFAVGGGHLPLVEFLQNKGADINTVEDEGSNVLHLACLGGHVEMVKHVLSLNITDIECRGQYGRTPLTLAVEGGHLPLVEFLQNKGADINTVDDDGDNILHLACIGGHVEMVKYVLSLNITDIECRGQYGRTPLTLAVERGNLPLVEFLQNKGADINTVDDNNNNILHVACLGGHVEMVKYLVTLQALKGFEKRKNKHGDTPLQVAQSKGYDNVVAFLKPRK